MIDPPQDPDGADVGAGADHRVVVDVDVALAATPTLAAVRLSRTDPTSALKGDTCWKARHTPDGPATVAARPTGPEQVTFWAWGPGAGAALAVAPDWLGLDDNLEDFDPSPHPVVQRLARGRAGVRMGRFGMVLDRLVPTIFGQLVIAKEAKRSYGRLVQRYGGAAPGPLPLRLPPEPAVLAELGTHDFHQLGVERKRAAIVQRVARQAAGLERLSALPADEAQRRLLRIAGIGPWTAASVARVSFGDPDAVVLGDYNLPHTVAWALVGKRRSDDDEMLELLAPFAGHRGRVQALLKGGGAPPRHGPRLAFRAIERH